MAQIISKAIEKAKSQMTLNMQKKAEGGKAEAESSKTVTPNK